MGSWLPAGFEFVSGLPEAQRRRRVLMPVQIYVDDSGGKGTTTQFVLAGLSAEAKEWARFADEWSCIIRQDPPLRFVKGNQIFKMKDASGKPSGGFRSFTVQQRDDKLKAFAELIHNCVTTGITCVTSLRGHSKTWGRLPKPFNDPYFYPFQSIIYSSCLELWEQGLKERFEITFDEHKISGHKAHFWYPLARDVVGSSNPKAARIMPVDPMFRKDEDYLPLQAADLFAGYTRGMAEKTDYEFRWLANFLPLASRHSEFRDIEAIQQTYLKALVGFMNGHNAPQDLIDRYGELRQEYGQSKRGSKR